MVLHTIIDINDIMGYSVTDTKPNNHCYKNINGAVIEGTKTKNGILVNRIISTNPKDYLNKNYDIGSLLK